MTALSDHPGAVLEAQPVAFPRAAVRTAAGGALLGLTVAFAAGVAAYTAGLPGWLCMSFVYGALFGCLFRAARRASRRWGTGSLRHDLGWHVTLSDIGLGAGIAVGAVVVSALAALPFARQDWEANTSWLQDVPLATILVFGVVAIVGAPLFEELFFRGLLQRSLTGWVGSGPAIAIQAAVFAFGHLSPSGGMSNLPHFVHFAVWGAVMGVAARRAGRLGPTMVAHCLSNCLAVTLLIAAR